MATEAYTESEAGTCGVQVSWRSPLWLVNHLACHNPCTATDAVVLHGSNSIAARIHTRIGA